jgi:hypothetical protein
MTNRTLYRKLRKSQSIMNWFLADGCIRGELHSKGTHTLGGDFCPITAVCFLVTGEKFKDYDYQQAAKSMNFKGNIERVVSSADNYFRKHTCATKEKVAGKQVRDALLRATGIKLT